MTSSAASVVIRRAVSEDAQAIAQCHYDAVHDKGKGFYPDDILDKWSAPVTLDKIAMRRSHIENPHGEMYVAEADGQVIGFMSFEPSKCKLGTLYVRRNPYGRVGEQLMNWAKQRASDLHLTHFWLSSSLAAFEFYRRAGFVETGRSINERGFEEVAMRLDFQTDAS